MQQYLTVVKLLEVVEMANKIVRQSGEEGVYWADIQLALIGLGLWPDDEVQRLIIRFGIKMFRVVGDEKYYHWDFLETLLGGE